MHDHSGHHHAAPDGRSTAFAIGVGLNVAFVVAEAAIGLAYGSLALLADAGHNLTDVLGLLLAWGAVTIGRRRPSERFTYGLRRSSILAALANALLLLAGIGAIVWEAVRRFGEPATASGAVVMIAAAIGVAVNGVTTLLFMRGREHDLNVQGAFVHMLADTMVSAGVIVAGALIYFTGWAWIDPTVSLMIAAVIFVSTWDLLRRSTAMALDAVPGQIDLPEVERFLQFLPGVTAVHDLHVWPLSTSQTAMSAHLVRPGRHDDDTLLSDAARELHDRFGIDHATIQIERGGVIDSIACDAGDV